MQAERAAGAAGTMPARCWGQLLSMTSQGVVKAGGELAADGLGIAVDVAREGGDVLGFAIDFILHGVVAAQVPTATRPSVMP